MRIEDIQDYVNARPALTKLEVTTELGTDVTYFLVTKTKETYVFEDETEADAMVDEIRRNANFESAKKTYKAGKMSRSGEVTRPETWTVVGVIRH
jgi:hypothetical protein